MKDTSIMEAALVEREEYLEELKKMEKDIQEQISNIEDEIDGLLFRIYESYRR